MVVKRPEQNSDITGPLEVKQKTISSILDALMVTYKMQVGCHVGKP